MEIEQRIGRIDRIGQNEEKIIRPQLQHARDHRDRHLDRVMDRIGVFEHAIGELEPILDSDWNTWRRSSSTSP